MQIKSVSKEEGNTIAEEEEGEDCMTPFLTPQHLAKTPAQSFFSVINSRDSLDLYHDAYSTLQRPYNINGHSSSSTHALPIANRERHPSTGGYIGLEPTSPLAHNHASGENGDVEDHGRVRHASYSSSQQPFHNPHHIGRLSLSTASLKRASADSPRLLTNSSNKTDSYPIQEIKGGNWRQNYRPCVEMVLEGGGGGGGCNATIEEAGTTSQNITTKSPYNVIENNNDDGWRRNYVECVEGRTLLLGDEGGGLGGMSPRLQEVRLAPARLASHLPPKDAELQLYFFAPIQHRQTTLQRCRDEFRTDNLYLEHKAPHLFVTSQWQQHNRMSCLYLGYRLFWALYFTMWAIWAWVGSMGYDSPAALKVYFIIYLTNWSIWALALDTTIQAINVILHLKKISEDGDVVYSSMPRLMKVSWVLSNMMGVVHLFVTLGYWIVVYPYRNDEALNEIGINTHIIPGLYVVLDVAVSATPRRIAHAYQPILFFTSYVLFNLIYYLCGGLDYLGRPALYPFMDWTRPGSTIGIMILVIFGLIPLLHALICLLYIGRISLWRKLKISRYAKEDDEMDQVDGGQEQKV